MKKSLVLFLTLFFLSTSAYAGTLSGKVAFTGTASAAQTLDMNADPTCAGAHSGPVSSEEVVVNPNGTLKNVFVYVKEGLEGKTVPPAPATPVDLDQKGCQYHPHVFGVRVGQPVNIMNSDPTLHNVHGMPAKSKEFNIGMPIQNMKLPRKFDAPEVMVKFKCDVHPWMSAYAGVMDHPFFAVTGEEGTFEIKDLPAGTYVVEAWHEKYGVQTQTLTVTDTPQTADFTFAG